MQLSVCKRCKRIILSSNICNNCLNKVDLVEVNSDKLDIDVIEYTRSMINNDLLALVEVRFDDMSIRVLAKIDKPSQRFKVKEWNEKFELYAI